MYYSVNCKSQKHMLQSRVQLQKQGSKSNLENMENLIEALANPLLSIDVALSSWPDITLEVSDHFYVIFWFAILFLVVILFNVAVITTGVIVYGIIFLVKTRKASQAPPIQLNAENGGGGSLNRH